MGEQPLSRRSPFVKPSPLQARLLLELVDVASRCYQRGWAHGTAGNFSLRGSDGLIWQSPTGLCKGELSPHAFIPVCIETGRAVSAEPMRPSGEMAVHLGIYRFTKAAGCVVHAHSPKVVARSVAGEPMVFRGHEMQKHLGCEHHLEELRIPVISNPKSMVGFDCEVSCHLDEKVPLVVLAGHGAYVWGKTPLAALSFLEALEFLCATT